MAFVYISNAEDADIACYEMSASGALTPLGRAKAGPHLGAMAASPDQRHLYAVVRSEPYAVISYSIDAGGGALHEEARAPLPDNMAYASVDKSGRFLFTASYHGDKIAVSPIGSRGIIEAPASQIAPTGKHPHSIIVDRTNRFVFVACLGSDEILQFRFDAETGTLTPNNPPLVRARPGQGPRHVALSKDNRHLYVLNEFTAEVAQFAIHPETGTLAEVDTIASAPPATKLLPGAVRETLSPEERARRIWAADILIAPDGQFLYTTERTGSTISLLAVNAQSGKLSYLASYPTEKQPRGIGIDTAGGFLIATGEMSDRVSVYAIDRATGALTSTGRYPSGRGANWVVITRIDQVS